MASCEKCMWHDVCGSDEVCEHFDNLDENEYICEVIDKERREFGREWFAYIDQMDE